MLDSLTEANEYFDLWLARAIERKWERSDKLDMRWHLIKKAGFPGHGFLHVITANTWCCVTEHCVSC